MFYPEVCTRKITSILQGIYKYQNYIVLSSRQHDASFLLLMCINPPLFVVKKIQPSLILIPNYCQTVFQYSLVQAQ